MTQVQTVPAISTISLRAKVQLAQHSGSLLAFSSAAVLFVLALAWMGYDLRALSWAYIGDQVDTLFSGWMIHQATQNLLSGDLSYSPMFYGEPAPFALTNGMYGVALLAMPLYFFTGKNVILTQNLFLLISFPLTAWAAYLWIRRVLRIPALYAVVGALLITFTPQRIYHIPRIENALLAFFFFALIALHALLERPGLRWAVVLGVSFALTLLISPYVGYILLVLGGIILVYVLIRRSALITPRLLAYLGLAGVLGVGLTLPFMLFRLKSPTFTTGHPLEVVVYFAPSLSDWLTGFSHLYYPVNGNPQEVGWTIERSLFMGFLVPVLSLLGWVWRREDDPPVNGLSRTEILSLYGIVTIAGYVLALGPLLKWNNQPLFPTPYMLLMWIPGFSGIRFPQRFIFLAVFGTAVLVSYALHALRRHLPRSAYAGVLGLILFGLLLEYLPFNGDTSRSIPGYRPDARHIQFQVRSLEPHPPIYDWLAKQAPGTPVFHYPHFTSEAFRDQSYWRMDWLAGYEYSAYQSIHNQPMIGGIASLYPGWYFELPWESFPNPEIMQFLRDRGARYILLHHELLTVVEQRDLASRMDHYQVMWGPLRFIDQIGEVEVYELTAGDFTFYEFDQPLPESWSWFPPVTAQDGTTHQQSTVSDSRLEVSIQQPAERTVAFRVVAVSDLRVLDAMRLEVNGVEIPLTIDEREEAGGMLSGTVPASALAAAPEITTLRFYLGDEALALFQPTFALDWLHLQAAPE